jgi:hypothetical protein
LTNGKVKKTKKKKKRMGRPDPSGAGPDPTQNGPIALISPHNTKYTKPEKDLGDAAHTQIRFFFQSLTSLQIAANSGFV